MTVDKKAPVQKQKFPLALSIGLTVIMMGAMAMVIRGCGTEGGVPLVISSAQYMEILEDVEKQTTTILDKADREEPLTEEEIKVLEKIEPKTIGLINFDVAAFPPYIIAAKIAFAEEKYEACIDACTRVFERAPAQGNADIVGAVAETRYVCSRAYFKLKRFPEAISEAKDATRVAPGIGKYWWALASAQAQNGQESDALYSINRGQVADPGDERLKALATFMLFDQKWVNGKPKKPAPKEAPKQAPSGPAKGPIGP